MSRQPSVVGRHLTGDAGPTTDPRFLDQQESTMPAVHFAALVRRTAVATLAGLAIVGCAAAPASEATAQASPAASVASSAPSAAPGAQETLSCEPLGMPTPRYTVTVPGGWSGFGGECGFVVPDGEGFTAGLSAWIVGQVPNDPCRNNSTLVTPDDGVEGLVQAILAQEGRNATDPVDVSLAGFEGTYLEWTVPDDVQFTDADEFHAVGCDNQNYLSWNGLTGGTRYQQVPGQVDRLWILDVAGQPVVIDASYAPDAPAAIREQLGTIVDSLRFEAP
jgi:hypothetical protein